MNTIQKIIKNTGVLSISQAIIYIINFFLLIYLARYLGEEKFGEYNFAISITALFVIFAGFGIDNYLIREVARNHALARKYLTNTLIIKTILSFFSFIFLALLINALGYSIETIYIILLFGVYSILNSFSQTFRSIFQSFERMEYDAMITVVTQIILFPLVQIAISSGYSLKEIALFFIISAIFNIALSSIIVLIKFVIPETTVDLSIWKTIIKESIPFGLNALFSILFFRIATIMLSLIKSNADAGIYNAAYNPLLALSVIPGVFVVSIYPVMSKFFLSSEDTLKKLAILSSKLVAIIGFPIAIGCFVLADRFIELFYNGQYLESIVAFQILAFFIPLRWVSSVTGTLLTSMNKQKSRTICVGVSTIFNIVLNAIMIPSLGYIGASIATVLSETFLYLIFIYIIDRDCMKLNLHNQFIKPLIASSLMGISISLFRHDSLFLIIILACSIYFSTLLLLKVFTLEEKTMINQAAKRG